MAQRVTRGPAEGPDRGTAMDERVTLRSHLDRTGAETPTRTAIAAVIEGRWTKSHP